MNDADPSPDEDKSTSTFWSGRYLDGNAHWELGVPSPALVKELEFGLLTELGIAAGDRVLVPGCGRGDDLWPFVQRGLAVTGVDFAEPAIADLREKLQGHGAVEALCADVFALPAEHDARYDLVFDHTCCCALPRSRQREYALLVHRWLRPGGWFVHVGFPADSARDFDEGPPFRLLRSDCERIFGDGLFDAHACRDPMASHPRRAGLERVDIWRKA